MCAAVPLIWAAIHGGNWMREQLALRSLPAPPANAPNVALIVVDTLRWDHLSASGYSRPTSPDLDRIAQQGTLFENAISASSWTLPSHASLLTGRYTFEHGAADVQKWGKALDDRYPTIAEAMRDHGYRTGAFSGNYLYFSGNLGFGRGFLHFEDYFHSLFDGFTRTEYGREFSRLIFCREKIRKFIIRLGFPAIDELQPNGTANWMFRKRASTVNREAFEWIDAGGKRPFFVFLNYFDVHRFYTTPPGSPRKFLNLDTHAAWLAQWSSPSPEARSLAYDECIAYEDTQLQNFFDELKKRGLSDNTLVIITSDHGDLLGEHGLFEHRNSLFRPLLNVPLIFWQPGHVPAGVKINTPVSNSLLPATIADMLHFSGNSAPLFPGPSLARLWNPQTPAPSVPHPISEIAHLENESKKSPSRYGAMSSLVTPQYHYIFHQKFGPQLYDWVHDPEEKSDLSETPDGKAKANELAQELQALMSHPR
jgi:arylsulfatase A-like enzyme